MAGQSFIAPSSALDRRRLGKFEVLCRLSAGGMSQIYLATQSGIAGFRKLVVLKTILPDIGGEEDFVRMFLEEARTTAAFQHPNIAQVYELDVDAGELFMAMEFVQGCTLVEMAKACRAAKEPIPVGFTLQSVRDTALALHYAHNFTDPRGRRQIVIHRDVAEKNIMVTYEGVTKLLDFGIAKALGRSSRTSVGMVKGTSGYMSPEQIRGEPLDPRSDIFSLGVVLHECLTGLRLFHGKSAEEGMLAALNTTVAPPSRTNHEVTADVDAVVMKSLQRKREDRFATALEFARAIEKAAPGLIWHPEQSAELVSRHFAERRAETRRLLEATNYGGETTGEIRIDSLMAMVKTSDTKSAVPPIPALPTTAPVLQPAPTPPTGLPNSLKRSQSAPAVSAPPTPRPAPEPETNPARPRVLRGNTSPIEGAKTPLASGPVVVKLDPAFNYDAEGAEAKTLPAAALPEEIKALRAKLMGAKPPAPQRSTDQAPAFAPGPPSVVVTQEAGAADARRPIAPNLARTIPAGAVEPNRTQSSDTVSITSRAAAAEWNDDEPEAKTAIGLPFAEMQRAGPAMQRQGLVRRSKPSGLPVAQQTAEEDDDDFNATIAASRRRSRLLAAAILGPLFIAAVLAVLFAAGLPPFGRESGAPAEAPTAPSPVKTPADE